MAINFKLLRQVRDAVLTEPARMNMDLGLGTYDFASVNPAVDNNSTIKPSCGTVGCIAGWGITIYFGAFDARNPFNKMIRALRETDKDLDESLGTQGVIGWNVIEPLARKAFRFTEGEVDASSLFLTEGWPSKFKRMLEHVEPGTYAYAGVIADRINDFIEEHGGRV